jgi:hypothetical protein
MFQWRSLLTSHGTTGCMKDGQFGVEKLTSEEGFCLIKLLIRNNHVWLIKRLQIKYERKDTPLNCGVRYKQSAAISTLRFLSSFLSVKAD